MKKRMLTMFFVVALVVSAASCNTSTTTSSTTTESSAVSQSLTETSSEVIETSSAQETAVSQGPAATTEVLGQVNGKDVLAYTMENSNGMKMVVSNYGCQVLELWVPDKNGDLVDVLLAPADFDGLKTQTQSYGRVLGRFANRIGDATFDLDGQTYSLEVNNADRNTIHGGSDNWGYRIWEMTPSTTENQVTFTLYSPDGDAWFPGAVNVKAIYTLTEDNEWKIDYEATTNKNTVINLTNHAYFNLAGQGSGSVLDQTLQVNAQEITEVREDGVPTGNFLPVAGTPFDFTVAKPLGQDIEVENEQLIFRKGYDHNFVLNKDGQSVEPILAATLTDVTSGRTMEVYTDQPGVQVYTANYLDGSTNGKDGAVYDSRSAVCLETQGFPDAMHHEEFPSVLLTPEEPFTSTTIYKFSAN